MSKEIIKVYADKTWPKMDGEGYDKDFYCDFGIGSWVKGHIHFDLSNIECEKPFKLTSLNLTLSYGNGETFVVKGANRIDDYESVKFSKGSYTAVPLDYKTTENEIEFTILPFSQTNINYFNDETHEEPPYLEITKITPEIKNFKIEGDSIDGTISCKWEQEDVQKWTFEVIQDGNTVLTQNGTEANTTFNAGILKRGGVTKFKLTAWYETKSTVEEKEVDLQYTKATIDILEVSNTVNVDELFKISWVSRNQTSFILDIDGRKFEGTTQQDILIPGGLISTGTKTATLTITYTGPYYTNYDSTSVTFVGYGKPQKPTLKLKSVYNSATPTFDWESNEQTSYKLTIKKLLTVVENSGEVIDNKQYYTTQTVLENNATYTVTLQVKNRFGIWSDEVYQDFIVQFNVPNTPHITAIADTSTGGIIINVYTDIENDNEYKNTEIWKREIGGEWKRMCFKLDSIYAWNDFYVAGGVNYEYKARNIGKNGGISESEIIKCSTVVLGMNLYNVEDQKEFLRFTCGQQPKDKLNQNVVSNLFAASEAPMHFSDGVVWWSTTLTLTLNTREEKMLLKKLMSRKLLLYKDNKGRKYFGNITNSPDFQEDDVEIIDVTLEFKESIFQEYDLYCGPNVQLIEWNGGWAFDGNHIFGGE